MPKQKGAVVDFDRSVKNYFEDLSRTSLLNRKEEIKLWRRYKYDGDISARNRIIEANLPFVANIAKSYRGRGLSYSDLIAEGNMGLIKAMDAFDGERGFKVISYSVYWIKQTIQEALQRRNEIQCDDAPVEDDEFAEDSTTFEKQLQDAQDDDSEMRREEHAALTNELISVLKPREREIIIRSFGLFGGGPETLDEISEDMGITKERVRQIKERALKIMRERSLSLV